MGVYIAMYIGVFLWVLIPAVVMSLAGAVLGRFLRNTFLDDELANKTWNVAAIALVPLVLFGTLIFQYDLNEAEDNEEAAVIAFVKTHPEVIARAGAIQSVSTHMIGTRSGSNSKTYDMYVTGDKGVAYPLVRADRDTKPARIVLICIPKKSSGNREVNQDPCSQ